MSTWHVYPSFIRLVHNSHVPVVLVLDVDHSVVVSADVADAAEVVPALARDLLSSGDLPDTVVYLDSPLFPGLVDGIDSALSGTGHRPHRVATIDGDELGWVLDEGRRVIKAVEARKPSCPHDVSALLRAALTTAREQTR